MSRVYTHLQCVTCTAARTAVCCCRESEYFHNQFIKISKSRKKSWRHNIARLNLFLNSSRELNKKPEHNALALRFNGSSYNCVCIYSSYQSLG
ncbi:hypothetical protein C9J12_07620 [Photobacterium frigidiphilum]|uniref:Uncharacterized protein n=1 Tax=Photobacterium frigidiphilum TaxID=264736 RepID=A0A2T3JK31_9GAMM|nr:hypothetical protein C9J12_07620 [Photobacterium frigidiphilum]